MMYRSFLVILYAIVFGMDYDKIIVLGISFGLGMLVGMQRETTKNRIAGVRTFTLITLLGTITGFIAKVFDSLLLVAAIAIVLTSFLVMANVVKVKKVAEPDIGQTTEVAAILMYCVGVYLVFGDKIIGVMVGGMLAILLYIKEHLHGFIDKLKDKDLSAIMTFVAISLVILPILPDETFDPLDVLNLKNIWLMVVLIVGISILGYFIYKWLGKNTGLISAAVLGGIISSTATTVSFSRKTKVSTSSGKLAAFVILVAVTVSLIRVLIEIFVVIPVQAKEIVAPILVLFVFMAALSIVMFYRIHKENNTEALPEPKNPAQFKTALIFALIYALILMLVAYTEKEFGGEGLYVASAIGGLANKDAITLSLSKMIGGGVATDLGWRLIMTAIISNLIFKAIIAMFLGNKELKKWVFVFMLISVVFAIILIVIWPENWHF